MNKDYFILTKTIPGQIYFDLSPIDNSDQHRVIKLTNEAPTARLPKNWALGVFLNPTAFKMFEKGLFTFNELDTVMQLAQDEQVYFGEELDFAPAPLSIEKDILEALLSGKKDQINAFMTTSTDKQRVLTVANDNIQQLTKGVISFLEKELGVQLVIDDEE